MVMCNPSENYKFTFIIHVSVCGLQKFMKFKYFMNVMKVMNYKSTSWLSLQKFMIFNLFNANIHEFSSYS